MQLSDDSSRIPCGQSLQWPGISLRALAMMDANQFVRGVLGEAVGPRDYASLALVCGALAIVLLPGAGRRAST